MEKTAAAAAAIEAAEAAAVAANKRASEAASAAELELAHVKQKLAEETASKEVAERRCEGAERRFEAAEATAEQERDQADRDRAAYEATYAEKMQYEAMHTEKAKQEAILEHARREAAEKEMVRMSKATEAALHEAQTTKQLATSQMSYISHVRRATFNAEMRKQDKQSQYQQDGRLGFTYAGRDKSSPHAPLSAAERRELELHRQAFPPALHTSPREYKRGGRTAGAPASEPRPAWNINPSIAYSPPPPSITSLVASVDGYRGTPPPPSPSPYPWARVSR